MKAVEVILESDGASHEKIRPPVVPSFFMFDVRALLKGQASTLQSLCLKQERLFPESPVHKTVLAREGSAKALPFRITESLDNYLNLQLDGLSSRLRRSKSFSIHPLIL